MSQRVPTLLILVGCIASCESVLAQAPPPPTQLPQEAMRPAPLTQPPATIVTGAVRKYLLNPGGQADGILLSDGKQLHLPPHLDSVLVQAVKPGDQIQATVEPGIQSQYGQEFRTISLTNSRTGQVIVDQPPVSPPVPPPAPSAQEITVIGKVDTWLVGHAGEVHGLLVSDGSQVNFPPPLQQEILGRLKKGDRVSIRGYGTRSSNGTCIDATGMVVNGRPLALYGMAP